MDLTNISSIKALCKEYGLHPSSIRGQNFLIDRKVLDDLVGAASLSPEDVVLEVGPGFGTLTFELAKRVKKVIAVEQDRILSKALRENLAKEHIQNVEVVEGNILHDPIPQTLYPKPYRIVANLPYQITSHFLRLFLETENKPRDMVVMVQKEVAERISSKPGEMSILSVSVRFYGDPKIIRVVPSTSFWPAPEVDSAILRIALRAHLPHLRPLPRGERKVSSPLTGEGWDEGVGEKEFFKVVRNGFMHRRQKLLNNLANAFHVEKKDLQQIFENLGLNANIRAQELSVEDWIRISRAIVFKTRSASDS